MEIRGANREKSFYIAVILFETLSSAINDKTLYEECFILIKATSLEQAKAKALVYGRQEECTYQNEFGDTINWSFKEVVDVSSALQDKFEDGIELYARHFRNYEAYRLFEPLLSDDALSQL